MDSILTDSQSFKRVTVSEAGLANQRGVVLIIVLVMLLLFSILGATVLTNSTSELRVSGNYRNQQQSFFAAEGGIEQSSISSAIYSVIQNTGETWTGTIAYNLAGVVTITQNAVAAAGTANTAQVVAENVGSGPPPRGSGFDDTFQANYYDVAVTGYGPNNSETEIDSGIARMQVKSAGY